ncbi:PDZ domain-containing protein [Anaerosinus massiliensis]|uniref:PDZ domain-containing protein n=1 Tax=Massilibacillus massiliensis TaxID=1806837 RepID=UPI000DA62AD3|nr:PDZ domain-containing protein [Massilibacillus massiliensis]
MLKRTLSILCIVFSCMYATVFASSNIVINDVEAKDVKNFIMERIALSNSNAIIEQSSDNNLVLLNTHTENAGLFGQYTWSYENRLGFVFIQKDRDVIVSISETCTTHAPNGAITVQPVGVANTQLPMLQKIKGYFNGIYLLGFDVNRDKKDGGFAITSIEPFGVFENAGIKVGDIIMKVNDVKLKKDRNSGAIDQLLFDTTRPTTQTFLIKRGDVEKLYTLTSVFSPPQFKKETKVAADSNVPAAIKK